MSQEPDDLLAAYDGYRNHLDTAPPAEYRIHLEDPLEAGGPGLGRGGRDLPGRLARRDREAGHRDPRAFEKFGVSDLLSGRRGR